jgi:Fe(3+) dicitrate transport protein
MLSTSLPKIALFCFISLLTAGTLYANQTEPAKADTTDALDEIMLERITVVGNPVWMSRIPGAASYVSAQQLRKQGYTDINRVLRSVSGVNIQEEDGFGLRPNIGLRGTGVERSTKVNIMEDGILAAPAPYSAPAAYYFPNMGRINSVEVRKGSSQIKYGPNTTGGAINLISTPIPTEMSGQAEFSIGERSSNKIYANFGNRTERFGYLIEVLNMSDDGFKQLDNGGDTGFNIRDFMGKFMVRSSAGASVYQRFELKLGYNDQTSDETYLGLSRADFSNTPFRRYAASQVDQINTEHTQVNLRHFALFSDRVDLTTTLYRNDFSREWYKLHDLNTSVDGINTGNLARILQDPQANATEFGFLRGLDSPDDALNVRSNNRVYYSQGIESILGLNFELGEVSNQIEFGVRLHQDEEDRFQFQDFYRMENGNMIRTTAGSPGSQDNRIGSATALSVFVQDKIRLDRWTFTPGIRFENIWFKNENFGRNDPDRTGADLNETDYTVSVFVPGAGLTFQATDNLTLIGGVHRGFSPPSPTSATETRPELSVNYELGMRWANAVFNAELIGFFNNYSNLLGSDLAAGGGAGTTDQFNAGKVRVTGFEFSTMTDFAELFQISNIGLPFNLNYTFTDARFQSDFSSSFGPWGDVESGDEIPFIPRHQLNAGISLNVNAFSLNLNSVYSPRMRTAAGSGSLLDEFRTDSYFLLDLSSSYGFSSNVDLFMNVRNLLNETYIVSDRPAGVRPGLPRTVMGGLRFTL